MPSLIIDMVSRIVLLLIHLFNKYLLSTYDMLYTILGIGNSVMIKTALVPKYLGVKTIYYTAKGIFERCIKTKYSVITKDIIN